MDFKTGLTKILPPWSLHEANLRPTECLLKVYFTNSWSIFQSILGSFLVDTWSILESLLKHNYDHPSTLISTSWSLLLVFNKKGPYRSTDVQREFPRDVDHGAVVELLISAGLPEDNKDDILIRSNGTVTIQILTNDVSNILISNLHQKKVLGGRFL